MFIFVQSPLEAANLNLSWHVDERTIFTTKLLDTLIPAISQNVLGSARAMTDLNSLANNLLPLPRQAQVVLDVRGIRVRYTALWKYLEEWVIPSLEDFFMQAIRLLEGIEVGKASTVPASLFDAAELARIHSTQVMVHTGLLDLIWKGFKSNAQYSMTNSVPPVHPRARKSYVGSFMSEVFQQAPVRSSPEDYQAMVTLVEQIQDHLAALYSIFKDSYRFFKDLLGYFKSDGLAAASSNLDVWRLRERWSFLLQELVRAKQTLQESRLNMVKLNPPLQYHAYPLQSQVPARSVLSVSQIPWTMDDLLGSKHSKQFEKILEDLTWNMERLVRYYRAFGGAVIMHPKTDFRIGVFSRVFEGRLRLFHFLEHQMPSLMLSKVVETLKDWFNPSTETDAASFLERLHSGALRDTEVCRITLQEAIALREIWTDISAWLSNFRFEKPGYRLWLWSIDASPQTNASKAYKEVQRIVAVMDDHEKMLRQLYTFLVKFVAFRDVATKDAGSRPIERSEHLHPRWSQLSLRIDSFWRRLYVISHEINEYGPLVNGSFWDSPSYV